jgi:predicted RNA-binding protein with RPS1 domain
MTTDFMSFPGTGTDESIREFWPILEPIFEHNPSVREVLDKAPRILDKFPITRLVELARQFRLFQAWQKSTWETVVPPGLARQTLSLPELRTLEAVVRRHEELPENLPDLVRRCLELTMKEGRISARPAEVTAEIPSEVYELTGSHIPAEIRGARWFAWERYRKLGLIQITVTVPEEAVHEQLSLAAPPHLQPTLHAALLQGLEETLTEHLNAQALDEALKIAGDVYRDLLSQPPLAARRILAVFVGSIQQPLGLALCPAKGPPQATTSLPCKPGWEERLKQWLQQNPVDAYVLPTSAIDRNKLHILRQMLPARPTLIRPAGMETARRKLFKDHAYATREEISAIVLAQRALQPLKAWGAVPPEDLGLVEYQRDLDEQELGRVLSDVLTVVRYHEQTRKTAQLPHSATAAAGRLNPFIRTLEDLRPGMELDVQVVNITSFGAFVTFGLETEGLIHISELSDQRVPSPTAVVRIGQKLRAKILEVDLKRKRISLSLRTGKSPSPNQSRTTRIDALRKLDKLFKD